MKFPKKFRKPVAVVIVLLLLAGVLKLLLANHEPVYQGRTFSSWFREAQATQMFWSSGVPGQPMPAIQAMGTNAVPWLLKQIQAKDAGMVGFYWRLYPKIPRSIRRLLPNPVFPGRRQLVAANLLFSVGPPLREFVPQLIATYDRIYIRKNHLSADTRIDWSEQFAHPITNRTPPQPLTAKQVRLLEMQNLEFQYLQPQLLRVITETGGEDPEIVPFILSSYAQKVPVWLNDDFPNMRVAIKHSEPLLLANVSHPDPSVRTVVMEMLGTLAPDQPELAPVFTQALADTNLSLQRAALSGLSKTKPDFEPTLPILARLLEETNVFINQPARQALLQLGGGMKMFRRLNDALAGTNASVRAAAARLFREYPQRAEPFKPRLMGLTNAAVEPDETVRREAAATLEAMAAWKNPAN